MDEQKFVITDDKSAEWALEQIKDAENERDRLIDLANEKIAELNDRINELTTQCENKTAYLKSLLFEYFDKVPHKETKTQSTYKLLSGSLVLKKASVKINHDDDKLIEALDGTEYIETTKKLKWAEYKKNLEVLGDSVIDLSTGEVIDFCTVEEVPATFNVKF